MPSDARSASSAARGVQSLQNIYFHDLEPVYDDFILANIKRPADGKWHWTHSLVKI